MLPRRLSRPGSGCSATLLEPVRPLRVDSMAASTWTSGPDGLVVRLTSGDTAAVTAEGECLLAARWSDATPAVRFEPPCPPREAG